MSAIERKCMLVDTCLWTEIAITKPFPPICELIWKHIWLIILLKGLTLAKSKPPGRGNQVLD